jgi:2-polyprenyl-6-methoxyphenol hydroxylase-like FAD-dependent oxidoreductase
MAGLAAAEVLSRHFEHVVVLERDEPHQEWEQSAVDMAKV